MVMVRKDKLPLQSNFLTVNQAATQAVVIAVINLTRPLRG